MGDVIYNFSKNPKSDAATNINDVLDKFSKNKDKVLLLLSGSTSLVLLEQINLENLNSNFTVAVLDERYSTKPHINNFAQIVNIKAFYDGVVKRKVRLVDTRVNNESQNELASRFNSELIQWFYDNPTGKVVATVGIGTDGHIAGIMPYPENPEEFHRLFEDKENLVVGYDAGGKNPFPKRVTTNLNLLRRIDHAIVYMTGEAKKEALSKVINKTGTLANTPARILHEMKDVNIFTNIII